MNNVKQKLEAGGGLERIEVYSVVGCVLLFPIVSGRWANV